MAKLIGLPKAKKLPATKPTVAGFLPFGSDDLLPQNLIDAIDNSDTASAAIQARAEFIIGNGIANEQLADMIVNRHGETLDEVVDAIGWNVAEGEAVVLAIGYNGNGQTCDVRSVSWEQFRLLEPDEFGRLTHGGIFPYLDSSFRKEKQKKQQHTLCPLYNPRTVIDEIAEVNGIRNYYGQLLYVKMGRPSSDYYAKPSYFGSIKNLETEAELIEFDFSTVANGFTIAGVWKELKGDTAKPTNAHGEELDVEDETSTIYQLQNAQGAENSNKVIVAYAQSVEELDAMGFEAMTGADVANRYNVTNDRVMQKIARRLRTPNELINIRKSGGIAPTGEEMKVASQMMQQTVNKWQRRISQILFKVFENWHQPLPSTDFSLENLNYFTDATNATDPTTGVAQPN